VESQNFYKCQLPLSCAIVCFDMVIFEFSAVLFISVLNTVLIFDRSLFTSVLLFWIRNLNELTAKQLFLVVLFKLMWTRVSSMLQNRGWNRSTAAVICRCTIGCRRWIASTLHAEQFSRCYTNFFITQRPRRRTVASCWSELARNWLELDATVVG